MIKGPQKRKPCDMSTWHRVCDKDGSTIAYCPDIVTAKQIESTRVLIAALENLLDMVTDNRTHGPEVEFAADVIYKAKGE